MSSAAARDFGEVNTVSSIGVVKKTTLRTSLFAIVIVSTFLVAFFVGLGSGYAWGHSAKKCPSSSSSLKSEETENADASSSSSGRSRDSKTSKIVYDAIEKSKESLTILKESTLPKPSPTAIVSESQERLWVFAFETERDIDKLSDDVELQQFLRVNRKKQWSINLIHGASKIEAMKSVLVANEVLVNERDIVIFCNARDLLFVESPREFVTRFEALDADVIFGASGSMRDVEPSLLERYPMRDIDFPTQWKFLNEEFIAARASSFLELLYGVESLYGDKDAMTKIYLDKHDAMRVVIDHETKLSFMVTEETAKDLTQEFEVIQSNVWRQEWARPCAVQFHNCPEIATSFMSSMEERIR